MRQAQQNRRGRGRNNNNRKGQNPLTRSYESNGPDVKIRGTPSHIAEKYVAMARDALSSGDPVLAENYLQHAEHYNRIIMTHREQQSPQHGDNTVNRNRNPSEPIDDDASGADENAKEAPVPRGAEPQPSINANEREERPPRRNNQRRDRDRGGDRDREGEGDRQSAQAAAVDQPSTGRANGRGGGRRNRYAQSDDQPEFLKRPVRRPKTPARDNSDDAPASATKSDEAAE